ncbi:SusC/RagA family TonB-linked outer membrane protein [Flavobacterium cellulosilyticum]|uniref:SusC/RagA family TonB-linked outer membrane protein n=1 Tax=Flavobacterium cellulosilyticum TaxID=2541731 RepID=UPI0015F2AF68|nr:TonB-dependent receptor [Flavobacterium cellulosilyticum]
MKHFIIIKKLQFYDIDFKLRKKLTLLLVLFSLFQVQANQSTNSGITQVIQQKKTISGVVTDEKGITLPGAIVLIKGTKNSVATDFEGKFTLSIDDKAKTIVVSFMGFESKEVSIGNAKVFNITIKSSLNDLDEVVVIGFNNTQKKGGLVSSITSINPKELKGPTSNLTQMMAGRVSGMIAVQRSGEPGSDNSDFFIRGLGTFGSGKQNPLILIDGIESSSTDMARLQPDDIAAFSVLKDAAAAAVYGARGANGVVLITTKSGKEGKTTFHFRTETRMSSNTKNFNFADNITYMKLANEATLTRQYDQTRLKPLPYDQNKIDRTAAGDDPYLYPNNNWINELIKKYTINQGFNLSASGGGEKARYYIASTYNIDNGILNVEGLNNFNSNIKLRNYSIRTNIDINLTPTTSATIRVYGQFDDYNGPVGGGGHIFNSALWSNPVKFPKVYPKSYLPFIEHPLFGGATTGYGSNSLLINPYAEMVSGYETWKASTIQPQIELKQDLNTLTKGLTVRAMGYLRRYSFYSVSRKYNPFYYSSTISPETGELQLSVLNDGGKGSIGLVGTEYLNYGEGEKKLDSRTYLETAINYNRTFNEKHAISGMLINLVSNFEQGNGGSLQNSLPARNNGISGRFTYGYDNRYLTEFNFGYNGSERFIKGNRYGFFPSIGVAYRISNEKFWEPLKEIITDLKFRGTYGLVGNDQIGDASDRFFYLSNVNLNDGAYGAAFGEQYGYNRNGVSVSRYANNNIGWEKSQQINLGVDLELYKSFNVTVDVFKQTRSNILEVRQNIGSTLGLTAIPATNFGKYESKGLDLSVNYNKQLGDQWWTQFRGNLTYATGKKLIVDELSYPDDLAYRSQVGQSGSQVYGYIAERLFVDHQETLNSPIQFDQYSGGDIKYRDVNGDGKITENDMVPIGHPTVPEIVFGFGGTAGYKSFDVSIFFQGAARTSIFINPWNIAPFVLTGNAQNGLLKPIADDHWSEDNRDLYAFWPRLSDTFVPNNNVTSTWWMRDGSFLRLKTVELGYNVPDKTTKNLGLSSARIYFSGNNLAVWSSFKLWDPEMGGNGLGYPIQSVYNLGLKLDF